MCKALQNGRGICLCLALVVGAGCEEALRSTSGPRWPAPAEPQTFVYPEDPPVGTVASLENLLSGYRRQGKVVLLDVWATWCQPSCDRFGDVVELHRKCRSEGFQCIAVAFDNPALWRVQIASFLRSMRCGYPCVIIPPSGQNDVVSKLGSEWNGAVPARLVFDRSGGLAAELLDEASIGKTESVVRAVLGGELRAANRPKRSNERQVVARARMVDVQADRTLAQPTSQASSVTSVESMAETIVRQSEGNIDWSKARVAVLPFTLVGTSDRGETGRALADAVAKILSTRHPGAVIDRQEADALLERHHLTPMGVEYDPTVLSGKADWTHVITGTLRWR